MNYTINPLSTLVINPGGQRYIVKLGEALLLLRSDLSPPQNKPNYEFTPISSIIVLGVAYEGINL